MYYFLLIIRFKNYLFAREKFIKKLLIVFLSGLGFIWEQTGNGAVSYTHLDVYKRQLFALGKQWIYVHFVAEDDI